VAHPSVTGLEQAWVVTNSPTFSYHHTVTMYSVTRTKCIQRRFPYFARVVIPIRAMRKAWLTTKPSRSVPLLERMPAKVVGDVVEARKVLRVLTDPCLHPVRQTACCTDNPDAGPN
jgi:hypothetical protein